MGVCAGFQPQTVLQERNCCTLCRILGADGASGAGLLYSVQDFSRRRCFRSGIVVLCAGFQPQTVLQERNCCTLCRISAADVLQERNCCTLCRISAVQVGG
ncbi:hypothetical protein [Paenibacillus wynnii]|uniref:hypothetical protein n=1 Tax=Paenibacillus wynnii TaxID=268407 RepID=UPI0012FAFD25|nr:hypothetical protein [Paenibacillus wynnii]